MTKAEIVERASAAVDMPKRKGEVVVNMVLRCIIDALAEGERVDLRGLAASGSVRAMIEPGVTRAQAKRLIFRLKESRCSEPAKNSADGSTIRCKSGLEARINRRCQF
jgi:hypothetical protein